MCKSFILSPGGADRYEHLEVRIVHGHNPDLVVLNSTTHEESKRFDLTRYATEEDLHTLVVAQGFAIRSEGGLVNTDERCYGWQNSGECLANPVFMRKHCALACQNLADKNERCDAWASNGQCESNPKFMYKECPVACGGNKNELR